MKFKIGDLIKVPEDKYSPEEMVIIAKIDLEDGYYYIYDVLKGDSTYDYYLFEYLDEVGEKVG